MRVLLTAERERCPQAERYTRFRAAWEPIGRRVWPVCEELAALAPGRASRLHPVIPGNADPSRVKV